MRGLLLILKLAASFAFLALAAPSTRADEIEVRDVRFAAVEDGIALSADFDFDFSPRLVQTVASGVPLYFLVEFELTRPRWYWFDQKAVTRSQHIRLSYHAISRQYRLSRGALQQSFASIDEALAVLRRLRNWLVIERGTPLADAEHVGALRMRLDLSLLPKPFQVSALTDRELRLESTWRRFAFNPPSGSEAAPSGAERVQDKPEAAERAAPPALPAEATPR